MNLALTLLVAAFSFYCGLNSADAKSSASPSETATTAGGTLFAHGDFMSRCDLVLASQSPRRLEIVGMMGLAVRPPAVRTYVLLFPLTLFQCCLQPTSSAWVAHYEAASRLESEATARRYNNEYALCT